MTKARGDRPESVCGSRASLCATRHTAGRLPAYRSDTGRRSPPSAGNPPGFGAPPAPETSTPPAPGFCPRAPAAEWLPAEPPPAPAAAIPSSRCGQTGAPTHRARSRSAAPTRPAAIPPPARSRVRSVAASGPAARLRPRSSAIPPPPRAPAQLLQRRNPLVAVDDHVTVRVVFGRHHHDGRLLAALGQRRQQPPLPRRMAHSQVLPTPVELVKLQLHQTG